MPTRIETQGENDVDIATFSEDGTIDKKIHPGNVYELKPDEIVGILDREGGKVTFRIKNLPNETQIFNKEKNILTYLSPGDESFTIPPISITRTS